MEATGRQAYWIAGADRAREDVRRAMTGVSSYWRRQDVRLPADLAMRKDWLAGYSATFATELAGYVVSEGRHAVLDLTDPNARG